MLAYADSSFLVAVYTPQPDSPKALVWMQRANDALAFTPLHRHELRNAIRLRVFRHEITTLERNAAIRDYESDLVEGILTHIPLPWTEVFREAERLGSTHTEALGNRGMDILHVAAALVAGVVTFLTFDTRQVAMAKAAGLKVKP